MQNFISHCKNLGFYSACDSPIEAWHKFQIAPFPTRATSSGINLAKSYDPTVKITCTMAWTMELFHAIEHSQG